VCFFRSLNPCRLHPPALLYPSLDAPLFVLTFAGLHRHPRCAAHEGPAVPAGGAAGAGCVRPGPAGGWLPEVGWVAHGRLEHIPTGMGGINQWLVGGPSLVSPSPKARSRVQWDGWLKRNVGRTDQPLYRPKHRPTSSLAPCTSHRICLPSRTFPLISLNPPHRPPPHTHGMQDEFVVRMLPRALARLAALVDEEGGDREPEVLECVFNCVASLCKHLVRACVRACARVRGGGNQHFPVALQSLPVKGQRVEVHGVAAQAPSAPLPTLTVGTDLQMLSLVLAPICF